MLPFPGPSPSGCGSFCTCTAETCQRPPWPRTACSTSPRRAHTHPPDREGGTLAGSQAGLRCPRQPPGVVPCPWAAVPLPTAWGCPLFPGLSLLYLLFAGIKPELLEEEVEELKSEEVGGDWRKRLGRELSCPLAVSMAFQLSQGGELYFLVSIAHPDTQDSHGLRNAEPHTLSEPMKAESFPPGVSPCT